MGQHWYSRTGATRYEVAKEDGTVRDFTLRDARKEGALYSFSTIKSLASNPGITNYMIKGVSRAWHDHADELHNQPDFESAHKIAKKYSEEHRNDAADFGTKIHDAIERTIRDGDSLEEDLADYCAPAIEVINGLADLSEWTCEESFGAPHLGYGGKVDLIHRDPDIILDVKTQGFDKKPTFYPEWKWQLAAYYVGLGMPGADCGNVVINSKRPNDVHVKMYTDDELQNAWLEFDCLRKFCFLVKKYDPTR